MQQLFIYSGAVLLCRLVLLYLFMYLFIYLFIYLLTTFSYWFKLTVYCFIQFYIVSLFFDRIIVCAVPVPRSSPQTKPHFHAGLQLKFVRKRAQSRVSPLRTVRFSDLIPTESSHHLR